MSIANPPAAALFTDRANGGTSSPGKESSYLLKRRASIAFAALTVATVALFTGATSSVKAADEITIGLVTKTEVNPYFVKLRQAATAEAEKKGAKLIARFGKFDGDNEGQVAALSKTLSALGSKASWITPSNSTGILGVIKKARDKGILVIGLIPPPIRPMQLTLPWPRIILSRCSARAVRQEGIGR